MGRGNRSCRNITNKHNTAKKYKQTENHSQPPKSTVNSLPNPQAPGTQRQRWVPECRHCSALPSICLREDMPALGRVSGGLQRCHAGSLDMHVHGTHVYKRRVLRAALPRTEVQLHACSAAVCSDGVCMKWGDAASSNLLNPLGRPGSSPQWFGQYAGSTSSRCG